MRPWRLARSLRARLFLLVFASVLPLIGMGLVREYLDYSADGQAIYDGLLGTARGVAVGVERDLQLRISSLETLATSPALATDDLNRFERQAASFLARQPAGTMLGLVTPDLRLHRLYGRDGNQLEDLPQRDVDATVAQVFATHRPVVTNVRIGQLTGVLEFSVDVPVERDGQVIYDLFIRLRPS